MKEPGVIQRILVCCLVAACPCVQGMAGEDIIVFRADFPGNRIAFPTNGELFLLESLDGKPVQLTDGLAPRSPALSPDGSELAFVSGLNISKMRINNRRIEPLTFNANPNVNYGNLDWSPDGRQILFIRFDGVETALCVLDVKDNTTQHIYQVEAPAQILRPSWAPDGNRILYAERNENRGIDGRLTVSLDLFITDDAGGAITNITNTPDTPEYLPAWSPSNSRIAFLGTIPPPPNPFQVYVMDVAQQAVTVLAAADTNRFPLAWTPDGAKILFRSQNGDADPGDIYVMDADGANVVNLTNSPAPELYAGWSPDGRQIAFDASIADNEVAIFIMDADGRNRRRLTFGGLNSAPHWSPDGRRIAFMSSRTGRIRIHTMDTDGRNVTQITDHRRDFDFVPIWSPDGHSIAFVSGDTQSLGLYLVDPESREETLVIQSNAIIPLRPAWSSDGETLTYTEAEFTGRPFDTNTVLMTIGVGGGAPSRLSTDVLADWGYPVMSPDGKRVLTGARRNLDDFSGLRVFVMNIDGSGRRALQAKFAPEIGFLGLVWSPDGSQIMASSVDIRQGRSGLYLIDISSETVSLWREDATQPDWVRPGHTYAVDARKKLITSWGVLKTK